MRMTDKGTNKHAKGSPVGSYLIRPAGKQANNVLHTKLSKPNPMLQRKQKGYTKSFMKTDYKNSTR